MLVTSLYISMQMQDIDRCRRLINALKSLDIWETKEEDIPMHYETIDAEGNRVVRDIAVGLTESEFNYIGNICVTLPNYPTPLFIFPGRCINETTAGIRVYISFGLEVFSIKYKSSDILSYGVYCSPIFRYNDEEPCDIFTSVVIPLDVNMSDSGGIVYLIYLDGSFTFIITPVSSSILADRCLTNTWFLPVEKYSILNAKSVSIFIDNSVYVTSVDIVYDYCICINGIDDLFGLRADTSKSRIRSIDGLEEKPVFLNVIFDSVRPPFDKPPEKYWDLPGMIGYNLRNFDWFSSYPMLGILYRASCNKYYVGPYYNKDEDGNIVGDAKYMLTNLAHSIFTELTWERGELVTEDSFEPEHLPVVGHLDPPVYLPINNMSAASAEDAMFRIVYHPSYLQSYTANISLLMPFNIYINREPYIDPNMIVIKNVPCSLVVRCTHIFYIDTLFHSLVEFKHIGDHTYLCLWVPFEPIGSDIVYHNFGIAYLVD